MSDSSRDFEWARQQHMAGRLAAAENVYRQILAQQPNHAGALHYLGVIGCQVRRLDEALPLLQRSIALNPNIPDYHQNIGLALQESGRIDEAIAHFQRAIELSPRMISAHNSFATALSAQGRHDEAIAFFHKALRLDPSQGLTWNNLGNAQAARGDFTVAEQSLHKAIALMPQFTGTYVNLGNLLLTSGRIDEAIAAYRKAIAAEPANHRMWSNLLFALHYHPALSPQQILREHQEWAGRFVGLCRNAAPFANDPSPQRKLRIGYISCDFREHPIAYFMEPILRHHDRDRFDIYCYANAPIRDAYTDRLRSQATHWRQLSGAEPDGQIARLVRDDRIDILIDLGAHTAYNRLLVFAHRAAPVQFAYLGYCATTGLPAIDYRITDAIIDPPGSEVHGTERLLRLDGVFCAYAPPTDAPVAALPAASAGHVTFGSLCTLAKVNDAVIELWAKVLAAVPTSRLLLQARGLDSETQQRLRTTFAQHGIEGDRLEMLNHVPLSEYFHSFARVDIALDPFPFSAHTTTCHALWMGVPVVTLTGETSVSRVSASMLTSVGLNDLIATTPPQYVSIARSLAADIARLTELRSALRQRVQSSPLMDGAALTRRLEDACAAAWQQWSAAQDLDALTAALERANPLITSNRAEEAVRLLRDVAQRWPDRPEPQNNLANALIAAGQAEEAVAAATRACALAPEVAEVHNVRGVALQSAGRVGEAVDAYERALQLSPDHVEARANLGAALFIVGQFTRATLECAHAIELRPNHAGAMANLGSALTALGRIDEAIATYRRALQVRPNFATAESMMLHAMHNSDRIDARTVFQEHLDWAAAHAAAPRVFDRHENDRDPHRRLRVGLVSPDLRHHPIARFLLPLLHHHDKSQIEILCYADPTNPDDMTAELRSLCDHWRDILGRSNDDVAGQIRDDRIDILIDLAGHTSRSRLQMFARKPAPVQATYLGYPNTTGLTAIDWRITDALTDPPGKTESLHTERLMRLPASAWCFDPPGDAPAVAPLPAVASRHITFGSFNNFAKVSETTLKLWSKALSAAPNARLIIKSNGLDEPPTQEEVRRRLIAAEIDPARVELIGRVESFADHLAAYARIDVALDTFPYHGTTTTCEALWMGVPVVTLAGETHVSRVGVSLLSAAECGQWLAQDHEQYAAIASELANDIDALAKLRASLRDRVRASPLCHGPSFARHFQAALREMWTAWLKA